MSSNILLFFPVIAENQPRQPYNPGRDIVVVKKTFRYSSGFSYNHLYQPECFYEKRYKILNLKRNYLWSVKLFSID